MLCHYNGILKSEKEDLVYIGGERRVVLINRNVTFDQFESHIRRINGCGPSFINVIYSLKCVAMSIFAHVLAEEDLTARG